MANYDINYDDPRFKDVESDKTAALDELDKNYGDMIGQSDKFYQEQIDASKEWEKKQTDLQNKNTEFAIEKIEQQKEQTEKDYIKEQSGAYVDWRKQSNQYGVNAEEMASSGLTNTGYSESSQVSMYNTYQNRVATARESFVRAIQNYDNSITEARLQNSSVLAEIAYKALQEQLELALQGFQYKNSLLQEKANKKLQIDSEFHSRYQDVLKQINTENALAEEIRQFNEQIALEREQFNWQKAQAEASRGSGGGGGGGDYGSDGGGDNYIRDDGDGDGKPIAGSSSSATLKSVLDLGKGPQSPENVYNQVKKGTVIETTNKKGDTVFKKASNGNTTSLPDQLYNGRAMAALQNNKKESTATKLKKSFMNALKGIKGWVGG